MLGQMEQLSNQQRHGGMMPSSVPKGGKTLTAKVPIKAKVREGGRSKVELGNSVTPIVK